MVSEEKGKPLQKRVAAILETYSSMKPQPVKPINNKKEFRKKASGGRMPSNSLPKTTMSHTQSALEKTNKQQAEERKTQLQIEPEIKNQIEKPKELATVIADAHSKDIAARQLPSIEERRTRFRVLLLVAVIIIGLTIALDFYLKG